MQAARDAEAVLSEQRFAQLDALLSKAGMYTQFLTEQMQAYAAPATGSNQEGGEEEAAEEDTAGEVVGSAGQGSGSVWRFAQGVLCMRTSLTFFITGTTALLLMQLTGAPGSWPWLLCAPYRSAVAERLWLSGSCE
jgi:hypothetical protein